MALRHHTLEVCSGALASFSWHAPFGTVWKVIQGLISAQYHVTLFMFCRLLMKGPCLVLLMSSLCSYQFLHLLQLHSPDSFSWSCPPRRPCSIMVDPFSESELNAALQKCNGRSTTRVNRITYSGMISLPTTSNMPQIP